MIAASTPTTIQPDVCVSGPLWKARHSRPPAWISTFVSRPGIDAYCGRSLGTLHSAGGLFHPGTAVEPLAVETSEEGFIPRAGLSGTLPVGAVTGGAGDCAAAVSDHASAAPSMSAPRWRANRC